MGASTDQAQQTKSEAASGAAELVEAQQRIVNVDMQKLARKNGAKELAKKLQQVRNECEDASKEQRASFRDCSLSGKVAERQSQVERVRAENEASAGAGVALVNLQQKGQFEWVQSKNQLAEVRQPSLDDCSGGAEASRRV